MGMFEVLMMAMMGCMMVIYGHTNADGSRILELVTYAAGPVKSTDDYGS